MRRLAALGLVVSLAAPLSAAAQAEVDAHSPQMERAAQDALRRADVRLISGRVLPITGLASHTSGRVDAIRNLATELRAAGFVITSTDVGLRVNIPDNVLFDFDKATLRSDARGRLAQVARATAKVPDLPVRVEGHTDAKGATSYNQQLSERRAAAVEAALTVEGVDPSRISSVGFGAARPVAPNTKPNGGDNPSGRERNRRVEIVIGA